ncbi:hypothetical protein BJX62DRAFT_117310 [Aspergillus germanicus]
MSQRRLQFKRTRCTSCVYVSGMTLCCGRRLPVLDADNPFHESSPLAKSDRSVLLGILRVT